MIATLGGWVVIASLAYLLVLGLVCLFAPARGRAFLGSFVSSFRAHLLELGLRIVAGLAFVVQADQCRWPLVFQGLGGVLIVSSLVLLVLPWRWHQRFALQSVPAATRYIGALGVSALLAALLLGWSLIA